MTEIIEFRTLSDNELLIIEGGSLLHRGISMAAGWAGGKVGAAFGTAILPGPGTAIGAVVGGVVAVAVAEVTMYLNDVK